MNEPPHPPIRRAGRSWRDRIRATPEPRPAIRQATREGVRAAAREGAASPDYASQHHRRDGQRSRPPAAELRRQPTARSSPQEEPWKGRARRAALGTRSVRPTCGRIGCARGLRPAARSSGGKLAAALAPTSGQDGSPGPGAHAQAKPMRLGPPAIVGLKRALAQGQLRVWIRMALVARRPYNTTTAATRPTLDGTGLRVPGQTSELA
jgi:hypothetical protein